MAEGIIHIRKGREKPIRNQHPWIFSGAIYKAENAEDGDIVTVIDYKKNFLGRGYWNHKSQIQVRVMTWQDEPINDAWWRKMLKRAIEKRYPQPEFYAGHRIVNAENDFVPGLIIDRYAQFLVLQALTLHIDQQKHTIAQLAVELFEEAGMPIKGVYERSDVDVRGKEGLSTEQTGLLWGEDPPELIPFRDDNLIRIVDVRTGHKTGYYLDQRDNHALVEQLSEAHGWTKEDNRILNTFCFSGGFGLRANAHVVNVDSSEEALELAKHSYHGNEWKERDLTFVQADVFEYLREANEQGEQYDLVILDPPKFAHNKRQIDSAARGYKDINLNGFKLVKEGGYLMTFSCSGAISRDLFQKIVFGALADSGRQAQIVKHLSAGSDHPIALTFPEGEYLKGFLLRVY
ncbi:MAG: class I SAM-dependent rRNA methyltransferase [Chloroflexota bacterium]